MGHTTFQPIDPRDAFTVTPRRAKKKGEPQIAAAVDIGSIAAYRRHYYWRFEPV